MSECVMYPIKFIDDRETTMTMGTSRYSVLSWEWLVSQSSPAQMKRERRARVIERKRLERAGEKLGREHERAFWAAFLDGQNYSVRAEPVGLMPSTAKRLSCFAAN